MGTDFTSWSEKEIVAFLDRRGEDHDDCLDAFALVARAQECEHNTGPAIKPDLEAAAVPPAAEDDELEAFMAEIEQDVKKAETETEKKPTKVTAACDIDDGMDEYMQAHAARNEREASGAIQSVAEADTFDLDDEEAQAEAHREIQPLEDVDHSKISYGAFMKDFYDESPDVFALDDDEVRQHRTQLEISAEGRDVPKLVESFEQCSFTAKLMSTIKSAGFSKPTSVQSQVLPAALSGRDVVGIAQTGSGKTAAFLLPMVVHCAAQARVRAGEGPIAIIIAPVRELAEQIHREARRFCKPFGLRVCAAFGGLQKHAQKRELQGGVEAVVATPGRLIDLVECGACKLQRVTMFVVDEVDRCFDLGFEAQVLSIVRATRPDRQTLLFSATLPQRVKHLVREALTDEVSVAVGHAGAAHADVKQEVLLMPNADAKMQWLQARTPQLVDEGQVVVFVNSRAVVDGLVSLLEGAKVKVRGIHGDMDQFTRSSVLTSFKAGTTHVMVATDVAARGLDIRSVKVVVNYDVARSFENHVHRIGRTGRAGDSGGRAITLIQPNETRMAAAIAESLQAGGKPVPKNLQDIALKNPGFRKNSGVPKKSGRPPTVGGAGLGFGSAAALKTAASVQPATDTSTSFTQPAAAQQSSHSTAPHEQANSRFAPATTAAPLSQASLPGPPPRAQQPASSYTQAQLGSAPSATSPVGRKRSFSDVAPPAPAAVKTHDSRPQAAVSQARAPKGFVKSSLQVGGGEEGPQIVLPSGAASAAKPEAPAAWLQKRIQQKKQFGHAGGFQARPAAVQQASMDAQSMALAVQKAQAAAARLMGSSQSVTHTSGSAAALNAPYAAPAQSNSAQGAPWLQHGQPGSFPQSTGIQAAYTDVQPSAAAPRMTPEEARRLAQEAANRASLSAAQNKGEKWEWAKT